MTLPEDADCFTFDLDAIFEDEEQESRLEDALFTDTPSTSQGGQPAGKQGGRRRGSAVRGKTQGRLPCTFPGCLKTFANETTLKTHKKRHALQGKQSTLQK